MPTPESIKRNASDPAEPLLFLPSRRAKKFSGKIVQSMGDSSRRNVGKPKPIGSMAERLKALRVKKTNDGEARADA